jgi:hypothetical protein
MILLQTQTADGETIETLWKGETVRIRVRLFNFMLHMRLNI